MSSGNGSLLDVRDVVKVYGKRTVVNRVSLKVAPGQVVHISASGPFALAPVLTPLT